MGLFKFDYGQFEFKNAINTDGRGPVIISIAFTNVGWVQLTICMYIIFKC